MAYHHRKPAAAQHFAAQELDLELDLDLDEHALWASSAAWVMEQSTYPFHNTPRTLQKHRAGAGRSHSGDAHFGPTDSLDLDPALSSRHLAHDMEPVAMSRTTSTIGHRDAYPSAQTSMQRFRSNDGNAKRDFHMVDVDCPNSYTYGTAPWPPRGTSATTSQHSFGNVEVFDPAEYCCKLLSDNDAAAAAQFAAKRQRLNSRDTCHVLSCPSDYASALCVPHDVSPSSSFSTRLSPSSLTSSETMSRQSSVTSASASVTDALDMLRVESSFSHASDLFAVDDLDASFVSCATEKPSSSQSTIAFSDDRASQLFSNVGFGSGWTDFPFVDQDLFAAGDAATGLQDAHETTFSLEQAHDMQRTESAESTSSSSSAEIKASERRRKHIENGRQNILPKSLPEGPRSTVESNKSATRSRDSKLYASTHPRKEAIPKTTYVRPQHPKLYCTVCKEFPGGFRGEHELRRHWERAHSECRKVWICTEPSTKTEWWPQKPLDICKQCKQRKEYNVYYNAAAHLRRAHFCPRKRGRKARGEERESRAGKAGGDWPPIEWLKANGWLQEIEITSADAFEAAMHQLPEEPAPTALPEAYDEAIDDDPGLHALGLQPHMYHHHHQQLDFLTSDYDNTTSININPTAPPAAPANMPLISPDEAFFFFSSAAAAPMMEHTVSAPPAFSPSSLPQQVYLYDAHAGFACDPAVWS